jgi:RNA polymerase sigma factor (sigma-70 family)
LLDPSRQVTRTQARPSHQRPTNLSDCRLNENELNRLDSDALIAYIREAHDAGKPDCARTALGVLVFRHFDDVERRVRIKIPTADVQDVAMNAVTSAFKSAFDGTAVGQFVSWLNTIVDRRIVDYHRRPRAEEVPLPEEHVEAEEIWGSAATTEPETGTVEAQELIDQAMPDNDVHRTVIDIYVFEDLGAEETADRINDTFGDELDQPMTAENIHQIASRFRKKLREMLDGHDT